MPVGTAEGTEAGGAAEGIPAPLSCQRDAFSLPPDVHYLNCAYMAPLPRTTEAAVIEGLRRKRVPIDIGAPDFFRDLEEARRCFARIVGGDPDRVALLPSASYGIAVCARNLQVERGRTIVLTHEQFPGNVLAWRRVAAETGAEVVTVAPPEGASRGEAWNVRLLEAVEGRTAVVAIPHVHWTDGSRFDLEGVCRRAREVGAAVVVDGTQSVGALPLDVGRLRPDAVVCAAYKWLLGPYSAAVAWFGPRLDGGIPLEETWMAREGSEDFQNLVRYRDAYQSGARRYDVGEVANFALLPGVLASLRLVLEWGPGRIQRYVSDLITELVALARERGFRVEDPAWRAAHIFGIRMRPDVALDDLKAALDRARVSASLRGTALRVSPHVYNDASDVGALMEVLEGV
ncbi:MAG TPA: aminotransferase class V-fold PLP-dependent enzyme [Longimicrobiales bacterium]|nr:aminotransferase class V-fold PLP-dependent enzyme [Longimicrobiales bacterium]